MKLISSRRLGGLLLALLAAAICVYLGFWQFGRYQAKASRAEIFNRNQAAPAESIHTLLPTTETEITAATRWRTAKLTGVYCTKPGCVLYVRSRPYKGEVGFFQVAPFQTTDGTLLVNRGFVPADNVRSAPAYEPQIPSGPSQIEVRLRAAEAKLEKRSNPDGQIQTITPSEVAKQLPELSAPLYSQAFGELLSQKSASPAESLPPTPEKPETSLGPHLSYAFQWWVFALFFPAAWIYVLVRDFRSSEPTANTSSTSVMVRSKPRRRLSDEEAEDAVLASYQEKR